MTKSRLNFHHIGIPTDIPRPGEEYYEKLKFFHSGFETSEYGIEWMRYEKDSPLPEIVKTIPHVAFEVDDLYAAIQGKKVIIKPNSPSEGIMVAMIEENGAPVEFIQYTKKQGKNQQNK